MENTEEAEDQLQLVLDCGSGEEGSSAGHFKEDASHAPVVVREEHNWNTFSA